MRHFCLLFVLFISFAWVACEHEDESTPAIDYKSFGIDSVIVNHATFTLKADGVMLNTDSRLILNGMTSSSSGVELDYVWTSTTEALSSVSISCKNSLVNITQEVNSSQHKYVLTLYNTSTQKTIRYVFNGLVNLFQTN
jgi:hypothetical protein